MSEEPGNHANPKVIDFRAAQEVERRKKGRRGGGDDGGMDFEGRLTALERRVEEIQSSLTRIETKIDQLPKAADFYELKGRVSQLPTVWQLFLPLIAFTIAIFGLSFALVRFALPHP
jgi:hypothetical protein